MKYLGVEILGFKPHLRSVGEGYMFSPYTVGFLKVVQLPPIVQSHASRLFGISKAPLFCKL